MCSIISHFDLQGGKFAGFHEQKFSISKRGCEYSDIARCQEGPLGKSEGTGL